MAGEHWSDIARRRKGGAQAAPVRAAVPASPSLAEASAQNPALAALLDQRRQLENRMQAAVAGGPAIDRRDALRFRVEPMARRRADHAAWEARRDTVDPATPDEPRRERAAAVPAQPRPDPRPGVPPRPLPPLRATAGETPGGTPGRAGEWLRRRVARAAPTARANEASDWLDQRLEQPRRTISKAGEALGGLRALGNKAADLDRQFADADRSLAEQGASEADRRELARMRDDLGLTSLDKARSKADAVLGKATALPDTFRAAERKVEDNWAARRDAIGGEDRQSYMRPLRALTERALGMGLPDIEERAAAAKSAALDRRRAARDEAQADDNRRASALDNLKARRNGV